MQNIIENNQISVSSKSLDPGIGVFHVILPGLKGGGRNLTGLREYIDCRGWVVASLSTRVGLKKGLGLYNLKAHYAALAQELVTRSQGRVIRIYAHSLGGIEVLYLMKALARHGDLPLNSLEVIFISPPGIGQKGFRGLFNVGKRLFRVIQNLGLYDQKSLLPIYTLEDPNIPQDPQRKLFLEEWLPNLIKSPLEREKFKQNLEKIDTNFQAINEINKLLEEETQFLRQRHKLLKDLVGKIINGEHIAEEKHQKYLQRHHELVSDIAPTLSYMLTAIIFTLKVITGLYLGIDRKILAVNEYCFQQKIKTKVGVVTLGRDPLVLTQDYARFIERAAQQEIPIYNFIFENEEHSSVAYKWGLIDSLEALKFNKNNTSGNGDPS